MYLVRLVRLEERSNADIRRSLLSHDSKPIDNNDEDKSLIDLCESGFENERHRWSIIASRGDSGCVSKVEPLPASEAGTVASAG
jgi:hypothetical protein